MTTTALSSTGARRAAGLDTELDVLDGGGFLDIYDNGAARPAGPDTAVPGGSVKLSRVTLPSDAWADAVAGTNTATKTMHAVTSVVALAGGTALWGRFLTSGGTAVMDGDVGTSSAAIIVTTTTFVQNETIGVTSCVVTR